MLASFEAVGEFDLKYQVQRVVAVFQNQCLCLRVAQRLPLHGLVCCEYRDVFNSSLGIHGTTIFKIRHGMRLRVGCIP